MTRVEQRVHQLAWALFWLQMAFIASILAGLTAFTVIGAIVFGITAFGFWLAAVIYGMLALPRGSV